MGESVKDPRVTGRPNPNGPKKDAKADWVELDCPHCEDEGIVYLQVPQKLRPYILWEVARCVCRRGAETITPHYKPKFGPFKDGVDIPTWRDIGKGIEDIFTARQSVFCDTQGKPAFPPGEPRTIYYRRRRPEDPTKGSRRDYSAQSALGGEPVKRLPEGARGE